MVIGRVFRFSDIVMFEDSMQGLNFMVERYLDQTSPKHDVLLLDINMPEVNGWQFLERFTKEVDECGISLDGQLTIYILSSSVDNKDIARAKAHKHVKDYIIKPISRETVLKVAQELGISTEE